MSSRNIFKFRLLLSELSTETYFWSKNNKNLTPTNTELTKETQKLKMLPLDSLFREELDLASSLFQSRLSKTKSEKHSEKLHTELGLKLICLHPCTLKERKKRKKSIRNNCREAHFNLKDIHSHIQCKISRQFNRLWLRPGKFCHKATMFFCDLNQSTSLWNVCCFFLHEDRMLSTILK